MCVRRERERERERDFIENVRNYDGKNKTKASWWNVDYNIELFKFLEFVMVHESSCNAFQAYSSKIGLCDD